MATAPSPVLEYPRDVMRVASWLQTHFEVKIVVKGDTLFARFSPDCEVELKDDPKIMRQAIDFIASVLGEEPAALISEIADHQCRDVEVGLVRRKEG
jgi:hypothetical protein